MITSEYSNQIIKESIQQEKVLNSQRRRKNIQKMLCYYSGENVEEYIQDKFSAKAFTASANSPSLPGNVASFPNCIANGFTP